MVSIIQHRSRTSLVDKAGTWQLLELAKMSLVDMALRLRELLLHKRHLLGKVLPCQLHNSAQ